MSLSELAQEVGDEKAVQYAMEHLNMTDHYARFVLAMERGELDSDIVVVEEDEE